MSRIACNRVWELEAYEQERLSFSERASLERHLAVCAVCAGRLALDIELRRLGRELPDGAVDELQARRLRAAIVRLAAKLQLEAPRRRWTAVTVLGAAFAIAVSLLVARRFSRGPREGAAFDAATIRAAAGTVWTRRQEGSIDHLELARGELSIHVKLIREGARFIIDLPDGQAEVRGTTFTIVVASDATRQVRVDEGKVGLRVRGHNAVDVDPDHPWLAPEDDRGADRGAGAVPSDSSASSATAASASSLPAVPVPSPRRPSAHSSLRRGSVSHASAAGDALYADAMQTYEAGQFEEAAGKFRDFVALRGDAPESEDAAFLQSVSLARAGHRHAAAQVAERYLDRYPRGIHRRDAAIMVARAAARDLGDPPVTPSR
jgi:hypothetical protein